MERDDDEERLLRSVALENAKSILLARQRAEEELVRAKEALELKTRELGHSLAMMRATLESTTDGILVTDGGGKVTGFNEKFVQMWWMSREIMDSRDHRQILNVTSRYFKEPRQFLARIDDIYTSSPPESYDLLELADGRVFERFSRIQFVEEQNVGRVWSFRDITERKQADDELRKSKERLQFVMNSMPQKIFTAKPNGGVDYFNPQWTEFTGLSFEQIRDWGWTRFIHPDEVAENVRVWQQSIDTGEPFHFQHRFRRADGEYRWHISRAMALKDAEGKVLMWVGSNTEIHDVKEADRRKNEFLAMLAHELRNPLAPIRNAIEVLRLSDGKGETLKPAIDMMQRQVGQMVRLIDDLLDVSRISQGKIQLRKERIELASVVNHAVEAARPLYASKGHELTVTLPPRPIYVNGDPTRLAQVVGNLLNNACRYTEKGGRIELSVERESPEGGDGAAVIRVRDNGIGIAAEQLSRIFDMFTQADTSLERSQSGLGIGLTLVQRLAELHDGTVEARSAGIGHGSEFVVRLPIAAEPPRPEPSDSETPTVVPRRILLVDDNRDSAESLAMLLEFDGHGVHTAYDGVEAVEAAARIRPDVILLDIGLPKLNGYEAARQIRQQPAGKGIMLVALTGWDQEEHRRRSAEAGFNAYLVKPVKHADLMKLLAELPTPV